MKRRQAFFKRTNFVKNTNREHKAELVKMTEENNVSLSDDEYNKNRYLELLIENKKRKETEENMKVVIEKLRNGIDQIEREVVVKCEDALKEGIAKLKKKRTELEQRERNLEKINNQTQQNLLNTIENKNKEIQYITELLEFSCIEHQIEKECNHSLQNEIQQLKSNSTKQNQYIKKQANHIGVLKSNLIKQSEAHNTLKTEDEKKQSEIDALKSDLNKQNERYNDLKTVNENLKQEMNQVKQQYKASLEDEKRD